MTTYPSGAPDCASASLLLVEGRLQREGNAVSVLAQEAKALAL